ncbi:MAG: Ig-like domain-containing protein, partial [Candidatus Riflebacteria bacterium]|nr:Ig-like domain-containing protein [Candidatus Riflebacteria bacterium]
SNESKLFGSDCTRIYKLAAVYSKSGYYTTNKITKVEKPIKITIQKAFPSDSKDFYLAVRSTSDADWQYSKLENTFANNYSIIRANTSSNSGNTNFTFNITTYNLDDEFTIFRAPTTPLNSPPLRSPSYFNIDNMSFSVQLPYLDLKLNDSGEIVYNTDLVINTCMSANSWDFSGSSVKTILTFLTDSGTKIESLRAVGVSTHFVQQTVSDEREGAGNKYVHTISFDDYPTPDVSNQTATYSFTLKLRDIPLSQFPDSFRIKTIFTDSNSNIFATESNIIQDMVLSYLKPVAPVQNAVNVATNSSLILKYIAHDIASISLSYTHNGLEAPEIMSGSFSTTPDEHLLSFTPNSSWPEGKTITASLTVQCCNSHGINGTKTAEFSFTTKASETVIVPPYFTVIEVDMAMPNPTSNVSITPEIVLQFSEDIKWINAYMAYIKMYQGTKFVAITLPVYDEGSHRLTFQPQFPLAYNASYTIKFNEVSDSYFKKIVYAKEFEFSTGDGTHATASISESGNTIVGGSFTTSPIFEIDFGKNIYNGEIGDEYKLTQAFNAVKVYKDGEPINTDQMIKSWVASYTKMQLSFAYPLEADTTYEVRMREGLLDFEDLSITPFEPYIFTTLPEITTSMITPSTSEDAAVTTSISILFSDNINWVASLSSAFNLFEGKNEIAIGNYTYDSSNHTLLMVPENKLNYNSSYTVLIAPNLQDPVTHQKIASGSFKFHTETVADINEWEAGTTIYTPVEFKATIRFPVARLQNLNIARSAIKLKKGDVEIGPTNYSWSSEEHNPNVLHLTYNLEASTTYILSMSPVRAFDGRTIAPFPETTVITYDDITAEVTTPATTGADANTPIVFTFSDDIAWSGSASDKRLFSFYRGNTDVTSSLTEFSYATDTKKLTINPGTLYYNASYTIKLDEGLKNNITKQRVASVSFYFETRDESHFTATAALADESNIDGLAILIPTISIDFKQPVMNISLAEKALEFYRGETLMTGYKRRWSQDLSKLDVYYTATLVPDAEHTLKMVNSIKDAQGRIIEPFADVVFRTMPNITPTLITPSATGAEIDTDLVLKFSNSISWEEADDACKIQFRIGMQDLPISSYVYSEPNKTLTIKPASPLTYNTTYSLKVLDDLVNDATRQEVATLTFTFTTADSAHQKASIELANDSIVGSESVLKPTLIIDFKKTLMSSELTKAKNTIKVYKGGTEITTLAKTWKDEYKKLELTFSVPLEHGESYRVVMEDKVKDFEGIFIDQFDQFTFSTLNKISVSLVSPNPTTDAATSTPIIIAFSDHVDWDDSYKNFITFRTGGTQILIDSFDFDEGNNRLTINPTSQLLYNTNYELIVKAGIKNNTTLQTTAAAYFEFNTEEGTGTSATLTINEPDRVDNLFIVTPTFYVDFGKEVLNTDAAEAAIKLYTSNNSEFYSIVKRWDNTKHKLTITCSNMLNAETTYKLLMNSGVQDKEGIAITPFAAFTFTTTANGNGSANNPYLIFTAAQLDNMRKKMTSHYKLERDIDIATSTYISENNTADKGWLPIGDSRESFTGGFNGNG